MSAQKITRVKKSGAINLWRLTTNKRVNKMTDEQCDKICKEIGRSMGWIMVNISIAGLAIILAIKNITLIHIYQS